MIETDVQKLESGSIIELFVLDATSLGGSISYFHAGTNGLGVAVVWQGNTYLPWPIQAQGFDTSTNGSLPRPTLSVSNVTGTIGAMVRDYHDLLGAKVTRKRTFAKYLDAENFSTGNPNADPNAHFPDDVYFIDQKTSESKLGISFALAAKLDLDGVMIPKRVVTAQLFPGARLLR